MSHAKIPDLLRQFRASPELFLPGRATGDRALWSRIFGDIERRLERDAARDDRARRQLARARPKAVKELAGGQFAQATAAEILKRIARAEHCLQGKRTFTWDDLEFLRAVVAPEAYRPPADDKPLPRGPTDARPGTEEYAEVIAARLQRGQQPFHPDDRTLDDVPDDVGYVPTDPGRRAPAPAFRHGERTTDPTAVVLRGAAAPQTKGEMMARVGIDTGEEFMNPGEQDLESRDREEGRKAEAQGRRQRRKAAV